MVEDRKTALVLAAHRSIAEHGLEGLRLRAVATEAGIDHSTLHHHFATKQDLVAAVVGMATAPLRGTLPTQGEPATRLHEHLALLADLIESDPARFVVLAEMDLRALRDPDVNTVIQTVEGGWRDVLAGLGLTSKEVELLIATVKGVSLHPAVARPVLDLVAAQLGDRLGAIDDG